MGYLWWGLATFVHAQSIILLIILLPYPTTKQWSWFFNTDIVCFFRSIFGFDVWNFYFMLLIVFLGLHINSILVYAAYSAIDYNPYADRESRQDAHINLLLSQRNYYITAAAVMLCVVIPRLLTLRKESARLLWQVDGMDSMKKAFRQLLSSVLVEDGNGDNGRYKQAEYDRNWNDNMEGALLDLIAKELGERDGARERVEYRPRPMGRAEVNQLIAYYDRIKNQKEADRANNNYVQDGGVPHMPTRRPPLVRSRFSAPSGDPHVRNVDVATERPRSPPPRRGRHAYGLC